MLQLRPNCEHCNCNLPANSQLAMICSYECTFCRDCVNNILHNVCPNCGGGFCQRPVRPEKAWRPGVTLTNSPATTEKILKPVNIEKHQEFSQGIQSVEPHLR